MCELDLASVQRLSLDEMTGLAACIDCMQELCVCGDICSLLGMPPASYGFSPLQPQPQPMPLVLSRLRQTAAVQRHHYACSRKPKLF